MNVKEPSFHSCGVSENRKRNYGGMQRERARERSKGTRTINSTNLISSHEACGHISGVKKCVFVRMCACGCNGQNKASALDQNCRLFVCLLHGWMWTFSLVTFWERMRQTRTVFFVSLAKNAMDASRCVRACVWCDNLAKNTLRKCVQFLNHFRRQLYLFVNVAVCRSAHG